MTWLLAVGVFFALVVIALAVVPVFAPRRPVPAEGTTAKDLIGRRNVWVEISPDGDNGCAGHAGRLCGAYWATQITPEGASDTVVVLLETVFGHEGLFLPTTKPVTVSAVAPQREEDAA